MTMKKYKLFRFGECYINREGDFVIGLLHGDKKHGYVFAASHAKPSVLLGTIQTLSRIVPNDGNWINIDHDMFNLASRLYITGHVLKFPAKKRRGARWPVLPIISKKY